MMSNGDTCRFCGDPALLSRIAELEKDVSSLQGRCRDMYANDDGQAWAETETLFRIRGWNLTLEGNTDET